MMPSFHGFLSCLLIAHYHSRDSKLISLVNSDGVWQCVTMLLFTYYNHVCDCSLQSVNRTRNPEMTALTMEKKLKTSVQRVQARVVPYRSK